MPITGVPLRTRRLVYGEPSPQALVEELAPIAHIDQAHLVMLVDRGLVEPGSAHALMAVIGDLLASGFAALAGREWPRGPYMMYEGFLAEQVGEEVAGRLHTGRSRNDMKATVAAMRLRATVESLVSELTRLQGVGLARARRYQSTVMPIYTHGQAAMPITYGHYLCAVCVALHREVVALRQVVDGMTVCPMGAGAVAGSDLPIDEQLVAALLGFERGPVSSIDSVASRDTVLRGLGAAAGAAILLSRVAADLQAWSTAEFGMVRFHDRLVGGSSAMPQKRNAFLLEHVRAKPAGVIGAWSATASAMSAAPFTNSIEVGTEAMAHAWPGFEAARTTVQLTQSLLLGAIPQPERMHERCVSGQTAATSLANELVSAGVAFRAAHHLVAKASVAALDDGVHTISVSIPALATGPEFVAPEPAQAAARLSRGGGPGAVSDALEWARRQWDENREWLAVRHDSTQQVKEIFAEAVRSVTGGSRG
ncbi:MAG: lyase family protein [Marmoricola sp.]